MKFTQNTNSSYQRYELVSTFEKKIDNFCRKKIKDIYGEDVNFDREDIMYEFRTFRDICRDVLYEYSAKYDPKHLSGASLFTYASNEIKKRLLLQTNPGMTENEIRNFNKIFNAIKYYVEKHNTKWNETESSLTEVSDICGLSVKVIKKTLSLKRELDHITRPVSFSTVINENEDGEITYEDLCGDMTWSPERQLEIKCLRQYLSGLSKEEGAILSTWVDKDYNLISERQSVSLLKETEFDIGRGSLNRKREDLKQKLWDFWYGYAA